MKYIRKAITIVLVAVFVVAAVVGVSIIFAVRNINVFTEAYEVNGSSSKEFESSVASVKSVLEGYRGRIITGVKEEEISDALAGNGYAELVSFEVVMPCTVNVTLRERVEVFAVAAEEGGYDMLDINLGYISHSPYNANNIDGSPNVLIENVSEQDYPAVAALAEQMHAKYSSVRAFAESMSVENDKNSQTLSIKLRCGLTMQIDEYRDGADKKAEALFAAFEAMPDYMKLGGVMYCVSVVDGTMRVVLPDGSII